MTELVICSGKGGTGKTSVTACLAALAQDVVLVDCDVDASNLPLILNPIVEKAVEFTSGHHAEIRPDRCSGCGTCHDLCRFSAIDMIQDSTGRKVARIDPLLCEGCGVCVHFCPMAAIDFPERNCGKWFQSSTQRGPLMHADLDVGAENSGKLVTTVREQANKLATRLDLDLVLMDGPPGIGCPVSAAMTGADMTLLVTEPSLSGLHDLKRIVELAEHFGVPALVCINKYDLSPRLTLLIEEYCESRGLPLVGKIPFDPLINDAQAAGRSLVEFAPRSDGAKIMKAIWHQLEYHLANSCLSKG